MRFKVTLEKYLGDSIPINYAYPLSSAIYRIIAKGDADYADFLHEQGYGKGFKFFTFSQLQVPFKIEGDRLRLTASEANFQIVFHLPQAMESFVKGLFQSEKIDIADKVSKVSFRVKSVESLSDPLLQYKENEIVQVSLAPQSPVVSGHYNDKRMYDYLSPDDERFTENLVYNWRSKIETCYDKATASSALLIMEVMPVQHPFKSRLTAIKADTDGQTNVKGWLNLRLQVTGEKRFVEILLNGGVGLYNSMGMGCAKVVKMKNKINENSV